MTAVGGALPKPILPVSVIIFMMISSAKSTRRRAVIKGFFKGILTLPIFSILEENHDLVVLADLGDPEYHEHLFYHFL